MKFLIDFKLFEQHDDIDPYDIPFDIDELDPLDEYFWDLPEFKDKSNYVAYDNTEVGKSNYNIEGAPVLLIPNNSSGKNPYELGFIDGVRNGDPVYRVYWPNRNPGMVDLYNYRNEYAYDLMFHKDYIPKDWTPNIDTNFKMGNKKLYELKYKYNMGVIDFEIKELPVIYRRRNISIPNSSDGYARNIGLDCFKRLLDSTVGYLQDCYGYRRKYNKNIMQFTNEFDLNNKESVKLFTTLIKRRMSANQSAHTRDLKGYNRALHSTNERLKNLLNFNIIDKINEVDFDNPIKLNDNVPNYLCLSINFNNLNIRFEEGIKMDSYYGSGKQIKFNNWRTISLDEDIDKSYISRRLGSKDVHLIVKKGSENLIGDLLVKFVEYCEEEKENFIKQLRESIELTENKIKERNTRKEYLTEYKRKFKLEEIIGKYLK